MCYTYIWCFWPWYLTRKIVAYSKDGEFVGICYGDLESKAVRLIDLNQPLITIETKIQVLVEVNNNFRSQNVPNINKIKRLKHNFNVSVADSYTFS